MVAEARMELLGWLSADNCLLNEWDGGGAKEGQHPKSP